jgi:Zn-dependent protease
MSASASRRSGGFRVLGFPVHVGGGFVLFMVLIAAINGTEYGLWLAGARAVFTLLHELGHAQVARWAGAEAEISLEFMAGFASYRPTRPISRPMEALIALSGPLVHITAGVLVLVAMGESPLQQPGWDTEVALAVWWAGPVIGALNLIPVLPLDGGNVVTTLLESVVGARARRVMLYVSVAVTGAVAVSSIVWERTRGFTVFIGFLLLMQLQALFADRNSRAVSPFDRALDLLVAGDEEKARKVLVNGLRRPGPTVAPRPIDAVDARRLLGLLPDPLPVGDPWNEYVLTNLLLATGRYDDAARYAADSYGREPRTLIATSVARAAAALGDDATAVAWLRAGAAIGTSTGALATLIDGAPELRRVRHDPEVLALRARLAPRSPTASPPA